MKKKKIYRDYIRILLRKRSFDYVLQIMYGCADKSMVSVSDHIIICLSTNINIYIHTSTCKFKVLVSHLCTPHLLLLPSTPIPHRLLPKCLSVIDFESRIRAYYDVKTAYVYQVLVLVFRTDLKACSFYFNFDFFLFLSKSYRCLIHKWHQSWQFWSLWGVPGSTSQSG